MKTKSKKAAKKAAPKKKAAKIPAYVKRMQESNKRFAAMDKNQKKVAVAKEVLMLLKTKKIIAEKGSYCNVFYKNPLGEKLDLQKELFKSNVEMCKVCAMGAVFMAKVKIADGFKDEDVEGRAETYVSDGEIVKNLKGVFTEKELRAIEYAFEGSYMGIGFEDDVFTQKQNETVQNFILNNYNSGDRMIKIMENVVANEGKFVIVKLKFAAQQKEIKKNNAKFARMSPSQKRVAIAEDVLKMLRYNKYSASQGTYCAVNIKRGSVAELVDKKGKADLQVLMLNNKVESCNVCAIGSVFASKVRLMDGFKAQLFNYDEDWYRPDMNEVRGATAISQLEGIFDRKQLKEMEMAFEGRYISNRPYRTNDGKKIFGTKKAEMLRKFYEKYRFTKEGFANENCDKEKLAAIMKNIIRNKGEFKIETEKL